MRYRELEPSPALKAYVRYYWFFEKEDHEELFSVDYFMPSPQPFLLFQLKGSYCRRTPLGIERTPSVVACGAARQATWVELPGHCLSVGVRFTAMGAAALGAFAPADIPGLFPYEERWARCLYDRLGSIGVAVDPGRYAALLDEALLSLPSRAAVAGNWEIVQELLMRCSGRVELDEMAGTYGCSPRHFQRTCARLTGYSPREYRALYRCELARCVLYEMDGVDLSGLAYSLGFCDQPHFCKSFKRWSGLTPIQYHRLCRPFRAIMRGADGMRYIHENASAYFGQEP